MADFDEGLALLRRLGGVDRPAVLELFDGVGAADFGAEAVGFVYGGVYQRPDLSLAQRQIVTIAALAALGYASAQLRFHVAAAAKVGCEEEQVDGVLRLVAETFGAEVPAGDTAGLDDGNRRLALVAAYTAKGGVAPQLAELLRESKAAEELREAVEAILHVAVYAGFPAALNALGTAREIYCVE